MRRVQETGVHILSNGRNNNGGRYTAVEQITTVQLFTYSFSETSVSDCTLKSFQ